MRDLLRSNVRFGSGADISRHFAYVHLAPQSGQTQTCWHVRLVPIVGVTVPDRLLALADEVIE